MASRHLFLSTLPTHLTVVCISDSASTLESIGLGASTLAASWDDQLRAIVISLAFEESARDKGQLLVRTLEQTKSSLSLAEGPCGLTCAAFFEELTDQAFDVAAKASTNPPTLFMHSHPSDNLPSIVRWPVAALPLNGARRRARSLSASRMPTPNAESPVRKFFNLAKVVACSEAAPDLEAYFSFAPNIEPTTNNVAGNQELSPAKSPKRSKSSASKSRRSLQSLEGGSQQRRKRGSSNAPTNIDQFSAMFSGGLLNKASRDTRETV